ncbi:MAG TPA: DNA primase [Burkholderiales bacterium]|nr:DNA primase [Burkholderiales bacterium]
MIPESFIQELLHRVDVVDVVERFVKLKKAGSNYAACCPFHSEKTPSFTVSPAKQFYHCFGCGAHGTAIGFLMEYAGLGFVEAVKDLAQGVGMQVPEVQADAVHAKSGGEDLHTVLLTAARYYRAQLKDAPQAIAYLKQRGLSGDIAKKFGIGYAPNAWQGLASAFDDYNAKTLVAAGLVKQTDEGKRYDVFRDRVMFPIVDARGNVIGFGGRVMDKDASGPKYLNSPETAVFEKGRELYGLYQARRAIREADRVIVVEGYMDVVALAQHGVEYAVATLGTATTPVHVQKLLRQADEIVFCFDGDNAGRRAAWRALENSLSQLQDGKRVGFLFLPQGEDPDTYVRQHGKESFEKLLAAALPLSRYFLEELQSRGDASTAEGRAALVNDAKPLLKQMPPTTFRVQLVKEVAQAARLTTPEVEELCGIPPTVAKKTAPARAAPARPLPPGIGQRLMRILVQHPSLAALSADRRALLDSDEGLLPVATLVDHIAAHGISSTAALFESTKESPYSAKYEAAAAEGLADALSEDIAKAELNLQLLVLERQRVEAEYERLLSGPLDEADRSRFQEVGKRLAELKGVPTVGVDSPR